MVEGNFRFQDRILKNQDKFSFQKKIPKYPILFLTCMDPRIDVNQIFQFEPGDVFILRNAGNVCTLDMMRSIIITIYKYKVKFIIVLGHFDCGMTKINMTELRKEIPYEFLKQLSTRYSDFLSNLNDFFKPFDNEISNVIHQINDLQIIRPFFPDVKVIGMIYDTQTGWIFKQDDFRDLLINENHSEIYDKLITEKKQQCSKFFEAKDINLEEKEIFDESKHKEEFELLKVIEPNITISREDSELQLSMPKIQIPNIYIPKIKIHIPRSSKVQKD